MSKLSEQKYNESLGKVTQKVFTDIHKKLNKPTENPIPYKNIEYNKKLS